MQGINYTKENSTGQFLNLLLDSHEFEFSQSQKSYMVINFRIHEISRGTYKLTQTLMLIKKKTCKGIYDFGLVEPA